MTVSYFIFYRGTSADPNRFLHHYETVHVPLLMTLPGVKAVSTHAPMGWSDIGKVTKGAFELIAQIEFEDQDALNAALTSPQRAAAREDMETNFPEFTGDVWHQATKTKRHPL